MGWKEVPAPAKKKDWMGKMLRLMETPPKQRRPYYAGSELPSGRAMWR